VSDRLPPIDAAKVAAVLCCRFGRRRLTFAAFHADLADWLPDLTGPEKLAVFGLLPERVQRTAWSDLRRNGSDERG
jgi:hypothetical protein